MPLGRKGGMPIAPDELEQVRSRLEEEDPALRGYRFDREDEPTRQAVDEILAFFEERLR